MMRWLLQGRQPAALGLAALFVATSTAACGSSTPTATGSVGGSALLSGNVPTKEFADRSLGVRFELVRGGQVVETSESVGRGTRYRLTTSYRLKAPAGRYTLRVGPYCTNAVDIKAGTRTTFNVTLHVARMRDRNWITWHSAATHVPSARCGSA